MLTAAEKDGYAGPGLIDGDRLSDGGLPRSLHTSFPCGIIPALASGAEAMITRRRGLFVAVVLLQSPAHAKEVAIAYCADADKIGMSDGPDVDNASAVALSLCRGQIGIADNVDGSACCQIVTTTASYAACVAFAGKNPATNYGIGDTEKDAGWMAIINCQADCLGYNDPGKAPDQECATACKVEASACR